MNQDEFNRLLVDQVRDLTARLTVEQALVTAMAGALAGNGIIDNKWIDALRNANPTVDPLLKDAVGTAIGERIQALERVVHR